MSKINQSINNLDRNLDTTIDNSQPIETNTNKKDSPVFQIINNIINIISSILKILPKNNYSHEDEATVFKCLFDIQYKLKIPNIPDNIEDSFINVKKIIEDLPTSKVISISGDLYTLNNCLITFNSKLHQPLSPSVEHLNNTKLNKPLSIYQKSLLYSFIICVLLYFFTQ
jgi:hypothetical protein